MTSGLIVASCNLLLTSKDRQILRVFQASTYAWVTGPENFTVPALEKLICLAPLTKMNNNNQKLRKKPYEILLSHWILNN
jgi:hypothetical protein